MSKWDEILQESEARQDYFDRMSPALKAYYEEVSPE
jgi:hypothetical protein